MEKLKILFLCTGSSCRSQMAEGWANELKSNVIEAYSAGIERHGLNPLAVRAMAEAGVDISDHASKTVDELPERHFDHLFSGHVFNHLFYVHEIRNHLRTDHNPVFYSSVK